MTTKKQIGEIGINEFLLNVGLYEKILFDIQSKNDTDVAETLSGNEIKLDCYCSECKKERTFTSNKTHQYEVKLKNRENARSAVVIGTSSAYHGRNAIEEPYIIYGYHSRHFICSMDNKHSMVFWIKQGADSLMKVGQYPSIADLITTDIERYKKILCHNDLADIKRGIGLNAHGIGAGAFVYLRRVFESLVEKAYLKCSAEGRWDTTNDFYRIDMKIKIDLLVEYLPEFIYKNKVIYGILSAGIHRLDETYCRDNFNTLKEAILVILDQELRKIEDEERELRVSKLINKVSSEISKIS